LEQQKVDSSVGAKALRIGTDWRGASFGMTVTGGGVLDQP
jgi:hypothetical protein